MIALHNAAAQSIAVSGRLSSTGYSGETFDTASEQQYLRARFYNSVSGRFNRLDDFAGHTNDPQSLHKYAYVHGDPIGMTDPTGMIGLGSVMAGNALASQLNQMTFGAGIDAVRTLDPGNPMVKAHDRAMIAVAVIAAATGGIIGGVLLASWLKGIAKPLLKTAINSRAGFLKRLARPRGIAALAEKFCFSKGTVVTTPTGRKKIEEIASGDHVITYDLRTGKYVSAKVIQRHENTYTGQIHEIETDLSDKIVVTSSHPFWVSDGERLEERNEAEPTMLEPSSNGVQDGAWINSENLQVGDELLGADKMVCKITKRRTTQVENATVYNLTIEGFHTYLVGESGVLTHNIGWCNALEVVRGKPAFLLNELATGKAALLHAHHIVMKGRSVSAATKEAQGILKTYKIDLLAGKPSRVKRLAETGDNLDNMAWAIRDAKYYGKHGVHSHKAQGAVRDRLVSAVDLGGTDAQIQLRLRKELARIRATLEQGKKFW